MFDHLDPEQPGGPGRGPVLARAARLRFRRRMILTGTALAVVAAVAAVPVALSGGPRPDRLANTLTETSSPEPTDAETPSGTASPEPTGLPSNQPTRPPAPSVSGSPSSEPPPPFSETWHDGKPGWSTGFGGCSQQAEYAEADPHPPVDGVSVVLDVPASFRGGAQVSGVLRIRNDSAYHVTFFAEDPNEVVVHRGADYAGKPFSDAIPVEQVDLAPGAERDIDVTVPTTHCGDGPDDPEPALPRGEYDAWLGFRYSNAEATPPSPTPTPTPTQSSLLPPTGSPSPSPSPSPPTVRSRGYWTTPVVRVQVT